jgi:hypothetical protein
LFHAVGKLRQQQNQFAHPHTALCHCLFRVHSSTERQVELYPGPPSRDLLYMKGRGRDDG